MLLLLLALLLWLLQVSIVDSVQQETDDLTKQTKGKSYQPLRRSKRRWVITTLELEEEDPGPFPKLIGELFNNMSDNMSLMYLLSGPGVDEYPEIGLFSLEDHENGRIYVHRPVDRETTPSFTVYFDVAERSTGKIVDKSLIFNIRISDVNDHAPQFPEKEFNITVQENQTADCSSVYTANQSQGLWRTVTVIHGHRSHGCARKQQPQAHIYPGEREPPGLPRRLSPKTSSPWALGSVFLGEGVRLLSYCCEDIPETG